MAEMSKIKFPEWYRKNRPLLGALARLWFLPKRFKAIINAILTAFDKWLIMPGGAYGIGTVAGDNITLSEILVDDVEP